MSTDTPPAVAGPLEPSVKPHPCRTDDGGFDHEWEFQDDSFDHEYGTERMQRLRGQLVAVVIAHFVLVYLLLA